MAEFPVGGVSGCALPQRPWHGELHVLLRRKHLADGQARISTAAPGLLNLVRDGK
jgi:hypothetical protein